MKCARYMEIFLTQMVGYLESPCWLDSLHDAQWVIDMLAEKGIVSKIDTSYVNSYSISFNWHNWLIILAEEVFATDGSVYVYPKPL